MKRIISMIVFAFFALTMWGQSAELIRKAEAGDVEAQAELAREYYYKDDYVKALKWARLAADKGSDKAQDLLATCYKYGEGVNKNIEQFLYWTKKAAALGKGEGCFLLGLYYEDIKNYNEAAKWYLKYVTTEGIRSKISVYHLGLCYLNLKKYQDAIKWFKVDIEMNEGWEDLCHSGLGDTYRAMGNIEKAKEEYLIAAKMGCVFCYEYIGDLYKNSNKDEAIKWYKKAINEGYEDAYISLGDIYKTINKQEAIYWYKKKMDVVYNKTGKEDDVASQRLNALGVYYHPDENIARNSNSGNSSRTTASTSKSTSSSSSSSSTYQPEYATRDVWVDCLMCHGTGNCDSCKGKGWCVSTYSNGSFNSTYDCPVCSRSGRCQGCYGTKGHYEKQVFQVR